jgi:hypothetical protein
MLRFRPSALVAPLVTPIFAAAVAAALASCASEDVVNRFSRVQPGMSKEEVVAMLGDPSSQWELRRTREGIDGERLQWGDGLSSIASSAVFAGNPERAYCVVFKDGKVVSKSEPSWVEQEAARRREQSVDR